MEKNTYMHPQIYKLVFLALIVQAGIWVTSAEQGTSSGSGSKSNDPAHADQRADVSHPVPGDGSSLLPDNSQAPSASSNRGHLPPSGTSLKLPEIDDYQNRISENREESQQENLSNLLKSSAGDPSDGLDLEEYLNYIQHGKQLLQDLRSLPQLNYDLFRLTDLSDKGGELIPGAQQDLDLNLDKRFMRGFNFKRSYDVTDDNDNISEDESSTDMHDKAEGQPDVSYPDQDDVENRFRLEGFSGHSEQDKRFMRGLRSNNEGGLNDLVNGKRFMRGLRKVMNENDRDEPSTDGLNFPGLAVDKRFMRGFGDYGKRFMRGFGSYDKRFMRGFGSYDKRFMRGFGDYGKRFMRGFGDYGKRFMRGFGNYDKRFMRGFGDYGKRFMRGLVDSDENGALKDKRFMRGLIKKDSGEDGSVEDTDKRFMKGLVKKSDATSIEDKRFVRGLVKKSSTDSVYSNEGFVTDLHGNPEMEKKFMRGLVKKLDLNEDKRFMRGLVKKSDDGEDKRFMKGLVKKSDGIEDKRFMRGLIKKSDGNEDKRFMRGLIKKSDDSEDKRFMKGLVKKSDDNEDKRFMRGLVKKEDATSTDYERHPLSSVYVESDDHGNEEVDAPSDATARNMDEDSLLALTDKRFMRGLYAKKDDSEDEKRFMKGFHGYGKRYQELTDDEINDMQDKRFMRGFSKKDEEDKRFMRGFSKKDEEDKRFMRGFSKKDEEDKRFMRGFSKKDEEDKRFMRGFSKKDEEDKRFMRGFSKKDEEDKRFMRGFSKKDEEEKRFMRGFSKKDEEEKRFMRGFS